MIVPEINKSGVLVLYMLDQLPGTYQIYRWRSFDRAGAGVPHTAQPALGWQTNEATKKILAQVANIILLSGAGIVRSRIMYEQMQQCLDVLRFKRWNTTGKSDRVLAGLIAMAGAFFEFDHGEVSGGGALERQPAAARVAGRERGAWDADYDAVFSDRRGSRRSIWLPGDLDR
jgi:hypothetical protein